MVDDETFIIQWPGNLSKYPSLVTFRDIHSVTGEDLFRGTHVHLANGKKLFLPPYLQNEKWTFSQFLENKLKELQR